MLHNTADLESLENGQFLPMAGNLWVKRDKKAEFVGSLGLIINPVDVSYEQPNWVTVLSAPKYVYERVDGKLVHCVLKRGDRLFVRPCDGESLWDDKKEYQRIKHLDITAIEEEDGLITPWLDRVMVKMKEGVKQTAGGLFLPDCVEKLTMKNDTGEGTVVGIGHTVKEPVELGDFVVYNPHQSPRLVINEEIFMFVKESDLFGVMPNE